MKRIVVLAAAAVAVGGSFAVGGASGGPGRAFERVNGHAGDRYTMVFQAGLMAQVFVQGDGDTDLDLYVYDENGGLIASDENPNDRCLVRWVPKWTGPYTIRVVNRGVLANDYQIGTN